MTPSPQLSKPKARHLSIFVLFIPTSLFAIALLHLACYGLHILCLRPVIAPFLASTPSASAVQTPHQRLQPRLLQDSAANRTNPRSSSLRLLKHSAKSKQFSARAAEFFDGQRCGLSFFMTWISNAESFGPRELVCIQSLFKSHPNACLLLVSDSLDSPGGAKILRPLSARGYKIAALSPDYAFLFKDTPAERWFYMLSRGEVSPGEVSLGQNISNLLRLALLYKYGGIYIDTDVIILNNLLGLKNAIGAQTVDSETGGWSRLNNAAMIFDKGHWLLHEFMKEFALTFNGNRWGHNGPYLVSRVVARATRVANGTAREFTVLPPSAFYPVGWTRIRGLFQGPRGGYHAKWVHEKFESIRRGSFGLHLWNRESRRLEIEEGSVLARIVMDCCNFFNFSVSTL